MNRLFVSVQILIVEIRVFIAPEGQPQCYRPLPLAHQNLTAPKFRLVGSRHAAASPHRLRLWHAAVIRPKDGSGSLIPRRLEKILGVGDGDVVSIQKQHLLEPTMENSIRLELPSSKHSDGTPFPHLAGVNTLHSERRQERSHRSVKFSLSQMPQLNGQSTPQSPEHVYAHPSTSEILR